jgi:hypothetical protein
MITAARDTITVPTLVERATSWVAQAVSFGDWGNRCMAAWGTPAWQDHVTTCARCRAVEIAMLWQRVHPGAAA